ncbi:MAG: restriction endonuclease subunit S [Clostridia bacterium]|nr:restriction endonuclease subunit S [Clostridia bacterium]
MLNMVKLGDVATYINGYAFKPSDWSDQGLPIIRIQDLTGNSYQANRYKGAYDSKYEIVDGDVLISWSASLGVYIWQGETALLNQHIFKAVFDKVNVDKNFFIHQVRTILEKAVSATHGATMKHLTKPVFDALPFYLPSIEEQRKITRKLDEVCALIELKKQQLKKLDELVKSRFIELFGDPEYNEKQWAVLKLETLCSVSSSKRIYQNELSAEGIPFLRISDLVNRMDTGSTECELYIPEERYEELKVSGLVPVAGDMLLTARGTLGRCYTLTASDKFYFQDGMITWLYGFDKKLTTNYLTHLFSMSGFRKQIDSLQAGSTVAYLSIAMTKKLDVMLPPIELQNQFAAFVEQTDKSKLAVQQSLEKLETMKKALMQQYFR